MRAHPHTQPTIKNFDNMGLFIQKRTADRQELFACLRHGAFKHCRGLLFGRFPSTLFGVHRIAFQFGVFTRTWYGFSRLLRFHGGLVDGQPPDFKLCIYPETIFDLGPWLLLGVIVGARALYVVSYWKESFAWLAHYGNIHGATWRPGFLCASLSRVSLACVLFAWRRHLPLWRLADVLAPSIALGSFFGRWGCLTYGCCYGRPTALPRGNSYSLWPRDLSQLRPSHLDL